MKNNIKIVGINILTVLSAFIALLCLFTMQGFSFYSLISISFFAIFADVTIALFKIENILRKKLYKRHSKKVQKNILYYPVKHKSIDVA